MPKNKKVLIIGAGNGYEVVLMLKMGFKSTYSLDIYIPDIDYLRGHQIQGWAQQLPFKDKVFDIVICCETMEHIPEELTDTILQEVRRVGREAYFTIATRDDPPFYSHVTIHPPYWWMERFERNGFKIVTAQMNPWLMVPMEGGIKLLRYESGVNILANCGNN